MQQMFASDTSSNEALFGWDPTPGIVSVWADRDGRALVWRRINGQLLRETERFRPWVLAVTLDDLTASAVPFLPHDAPDAENAAITVRELAGPPASYRFLISATSWRLLERTLASGATIRHNRPIGNLYELDEYYRVGTVEQYLMNSGRVFFRNLNYTDLCRMQIDFETTALDGTRGRIFLAAVRDSRGLALTLDAPTPADEPRLIHDLLALIQDRDPDVIENHNLFGFDLPFLETRAAAHRIPLALGRVGGPMLLERYEEPSGWRGRKRTRYSIPGRELVDTLDAVRRHDFVVRDMPSHRLKDVARYFGFASPERTYIPGAEVYATYRSDPAMVRRYALDDVAEVDALSQRLLGAPFALAGMAPRRYERMVSAGPAMGILEPILVRAYLRAGAAPPYKAESPNQRETHAGGALYLFATGVAEHVVKADVASLYPSLMRTFRIGPACDRIGALLYVLDTLLTLRLQHKDAARAAPPGTQEQSHHDSLQAAMKLLINSAYGYMGAGSMAMFADSHAANEVTRRGREVLGQVVDALRERGTALIEADTDGVYFAVPDGWDAQRERELVAEVGALLPDGIRLEYEGRYQAMLSHEVKNYALLTYNDALIVRGVAMRSSRAEPYGDAFLRTALRALLHGDVTGVEQAFQATVSALRERRLTANDLGARVRLSKSPDEYMANRQRHPEPQYEALLTVGRSDWYVGERVRFYRRSDKSYVWLPDETDEPIDQFDDEAEALADPIAPSSAAGQATDYDIDHYLHVLVNSYASRLRKSFAPDDFAQLFRVDTQIGLFDTPIEQIQPLWIRPDSFAP